MLSVTMFGAASFSVNGVVVKSDLGQAGRLLACYLFEFAGRLHRRERLADLFWGDMDPNRARSALNTAIWRIRKILDLGSKGAARHLITIGNDVMLEQCDSVLIDTRQLENASRRVLSLTEGQVLTNREIEDISAVVKVYSGPFLDGYDNDWVLQERERLHCLFVRSTSELMRTAAIQCRYELALDFGRRILAIDTLRESVQRDVMLLLALNGQRVEAIRAYLRFTNLLKSELDIEPMPETRRLHDNIRSGQVFNWIHDHAAAQFTNQKTQSI